MLGGSTSSVRQLTPTDLQGYTATRGWWYSSRSLGRAPTFLTRPGPVCFIIIAFLFSFPSMHVRFVAALVLFFFFSSFRFPFSLLACVTTPRFVSCRCFSLYASMNELLRPIWTSLYLIMDRTIYGLFFLHDPIDAVHAGAAISLRIRTSVMHAQPSATN
jgi:hypothetical protein